MRVEIIVEDGPPQLRVLPVETTVGIDPDPADVVEIPDSLLDARRALLGQLEEIDEVILEDHASKHTRRAFQKGRRRHARDKTPDERLPLWRSRAFQLVAVTALFSVLSSMATWAITRPDPPPGPSSDRASLTLEQTPSPANNWTLRVMGLGWEGDNSVEVTYPTGLEDTQTTEVQLFPDTKLLDYEVTLPRLPPGTYTVKARGVQSSTVQTENFTIPDR
jgi:hypothetical protein